MAQPASTVSKKAACFLPLLLLWLVALLLALACVRFQEQRGLSPAVMDFLQKADQLWRTGAMPHSATYPPMVIWIAAAVHCLGVTTIHPYIFNFCLFGIGIGLMYGLARQLLQSHWLAFTAVLLGLLNPYFAWTLMLSKDSSAEFVFLGAFLWLVLIACALPKETPQRKKLWVGLGILASAACMSLTRVTGVFVAFTAIAIALLRSSLAWERRFHLCCGGAFLAFVLLFCAYNYKQVGAFALATNGGYNLYLGNHPAYLHGQPHYDIDVFLRPIDLTAEVGSLSEAEQDRAYKEKALHFIQADPAAFLYRTILKSVWHWFNLEKIPNYTSSSQVQSRSEDGGWIAHLAPIQIRSSLAYVLYKLVYLPLFILALVALFRNQIERHHALLWAPLLGLWPVVALTFPDTRFKICAEVIVWPALVAVVSRWPRRTPSNRVQPLPAHGPLGRSTVGYYLTI